jgi:ubiquinone/menaquinone biosynthesis C-methylase UbiE
MAETPSNNPPRALVGETALHAAARYSGDPWTPENPYFAAAESVMARIWADMIEPFIRGSDFTCVLDLATGQGRNAAMLLPLAQQLILVDIQPANIEICRKRFGKDPRVAYLVNNGYDLRGVPSGVVTLLYCFDAMVHFDSDVVRAYLAETQRVLAPGGRAFLHHSNYQDGDDWRTAPASRAFMSQPLMRHYAAKEGLTVRRQQVIDWGGVPKLDCLSLLEKP